MDTWPCNQMAQLENGHHRVSAPDSAITFPGKVTWAAQGGGALCDSFQAMLGKVP